MKLVQDPIEWSDGRQRNIQQSNGIFDRRSQFGESTPVVETEHVQEDVEAERHEKLFKFEH